MSVLELFRIKFEGHRIALWYKFALNTADFADRLAAFSQEKVPAVAMRTDTRLTPDIWRSEYQQQPWQY